MNAHDLERWLRKVDGKLDLLLREAELKDELEVEVRRAYRRGYKAGYEVDRRRRRREGE